MDILIKASQFLLAISILVLIHEFGHFIAARFFGIKVEKFFLFFDVGGFKLFRIKRGETEYGIGWLPLGGYVKITGMIDESMDKNFVESAPQPWEFRSKPAWQRLIVMLGGIIMNVILGVLIFVLHTWYYGEKHIPRSEMNNGIVAYDLGRKVGFRSGDIITAVNGDSLKYPDQIFSSRLFLEKGLTFNIRRAGNDTSITLPSSFGKDYLTSMEADADTAFIELKNRFAVDSVSPHTGAAMAGLKKNDSIVAVNGKKISFFTDLRSELAKYKKQTVDLTVHRQGTEIHLNAQVNDSAKLGFFQKPTQEHIDFTFPAAIRRGSYKAWHAISDNVVGLWRMITGYLPAKKSLHGLIGIANAYGGTWDWNWFWALTGLISMALAFMNLLPIPALDGGHVLFLVVEMVRRKPLSYRFLEVAQMVGMVLLFLLMGFALYNDFAQIVFK